MCRLEMQEGWTGLGWVTDGLVSGEGGQTWVGQGVADFTIPGIVPIKSEMSFGSFLEGIFKQSWH